MRHLALLLLISLCFVGCSVIRPSPRQNLTSYELTAIANKPRVATKTSPLVIMVNTTLAGPGYETNAMVYSDLPYQLNYYTKNRWIAPPAQMINASIVSTLHQSHYFKAVAIAPYIGEHDLRLDTRLIELKHDLQTQPGHAVLKLYVQLVDVKQQTILASKEFTVITNVTANTPQAYVIAANVGLQRLLNQVLQFCIINSGHPHA